MVLDAHTFLTRFALYLQYLEMRFNRLIRLIGTSMYILQTVNKGWVGGVGGGGLVSNVVEKHLLLLTLWKSAQVTLIPA